MKEKVSVKGLGSISNQFLSFQDELIKIATKIDKKTASF